jgi:hypothetical protein
MKTLALPVAILLLPAVVLCLPVAAEDMVLADSQPDWSLGIAAFEGKDLSPENVYLTRSFPLLLRERLEGVPEHYFGEEEVRAYRRQIIQKERQRLVEAVASDRRARDELFFTSPSARDKAAEYEQRIAANLELIRKLGELDPESIAFSQSKPLRFVSGADGELVFDKEVLSPFQLAKQQDLDALIWGRFEEVQGFLYFEVSLFHAVLGETLYTYSDAAAAVDLYDRFDELTVELATILWGRDWGSLTVQTEPPGASVWIDQEFQGRTPLDIPYLLPGSKRIRVESSGYQTESRTIEVSPYTEQVQSFTLIPQAPQTFTLSSDPAGAAVYLGSEWLGTTPVSLDKPEELGRFLLRRDGYLDFPLYGGPTIGQSVTVELVPQEVDPRELQDQRRRQLYRSLGAFALSIPIPMFSWGYRIDAIADAQQLEAAGRVSESQAALGRANICSGVYLGGMALSGGLFANLLVRLIRYIRTADRKA